MLYHPFDYRMESTLSIGITHSKLEITKVIPLFKKTAIDCLEIFIPYRYYFQPTKMSELISFNQLFGCFISAELTASKLIGRLRSETEYQQIPFSIFIDLSRAFDTPGSNVSWGKCTKYVNMRQAEITYLAKLVSSLLRCHTKIYQELRCYTNRE